LKYKKKKIPITHVSLEEDAAAIVKEKNGNITYKLSRLGIPLVEIATGLLKRYTPEEIQDIAYYIGIICRSVGKVKRGIGSIRQDVNVSISRGARVEIKGVQELGTLSKVIENEVQRQLSLLEIKKELKKRKVKRISAKPTDVTEMLIDSRNKILKSIIQNDGRIFAIILPKFIGLLKRELCPGKTLGRELADLATAFGIKGIFHSDEDLIKYQLLDDFVKLRKVLRVGDRDVVILIGEVKDKGKVARQLIKRCKQLLEGVKEETRATNPDGTTKYTRPLPGAARLYPETDVVPVTIEKERIKSIKKKLPEPWTKKLTRFKSKLKLSDDLAKQILRSEYLELFEKIIKTKRRVEPSVVANTFVSLLKDLKKRENVKIENLTEKHFFKVFDYLSKKKIVKEAIPEILKYLATNPEKKVSDAIKELKLRPISIKKLRKIVKEIIAQPGINYEKAVGIVMGRVRGRIEAQVVMKTVKKMMKG
jgi:glutamyl-tRNA(Gln) amidotransferase subunit E